MRQPKGRFKSSKGPTVENLDARIQKNKKYQLKLLAKEIKKAKQFEVRKIVRRLKETNKDEEVTVTKLENQLAAARTADVQALAVVTAIANDICPDEDAAAHSGTFPSDQEEQATVVFKRIMAAKCVLDKVASIQQDLKALQQRAARIVAKAAAGEEAEDGADTKKKKGKEKEEKIDEFAAQALEKLLGQKQSKGRSGSDTSHDSDGDSGLVDQDMSDLSDDETEEQEMGNNGAKPTSKKAQKVEPAKPVKKKPKNRLGQRARRALAEHVHGPSAAHVKKQQELERQQQRQQELEKNQRYSEQRAAARESRPRYDARPPAPAVEEESLHPSWIAKKKLAEQQKQLFVAKGTKVTFNDDSD